MAFTKSFCLFLHYLLKTLVAYYKKKLEKHFVLSCSNEVRCSAFTILIIIFCFSVRVYVVRCGNNFNCRLFNTGFNLIFNDLTHISSTMPNMLSCTCYPACSMFTTYFIAAYFSLKQYSASHIIKDSVGTFAPPQKMIFVKFFLNREALVRLEGSNRDLHCTSER